MKNSIKYLMVFGLMVSGLRASETENQKDIANKNATHAAEILKSTASAATKPAETKQPETKPVTAAPEHQAPAMPVASPMPASVAAPSAATTETKAEAKALQAKEAMQTPMAPMAAKPEPMQKHEEKSVGFFGKIGHAIEGFWHGLFHRHETKKVDTAAQNKPMHSPLNAEDLADTAAESVEE
jgi:type IV secretory pathway VirB10-like protein